MAAEPHPVALHLAPFAHDAELAFVDDFVDGKAAPVLPLHHHGLDAAEPRKARDDVDAFAMNAPTRIVRCLPLLHMC